MNKPSWVVEGRSCKRLPCGRTCRVAKVDTDRGRALIEDYSAGRFWVTFKTLSAKWAEYDYSDRINPCER